MVVQNSYPLVFNYGNATDKITNELLHNHT